MRRHPLLSVIVLALFGCGIALSSCASTGTGSSAATPAANVTAATTTPESGTVTVPAAAPTQDPAFTQAPEPTSTPTPNATPSSTLTPTATPDPTPTPTTKAAESTPTIEPTAEAHRFVISRKAKKYYYCDSDGAWRGLAKGNLVWFDSEAEVQAAYPGMVLHEPCR